MNSRITRRRLLGQAAWGALGAALGFQGRLRAATPQHEILSTRVISLRPGFYHGWPTVARRAQGQLVLVCSGGREGHICPFGQVELMRSHDEGKTWSYPRVLVDSPIDDRDAGVLETAAGTLLATTFTSLAYEDHYLKKGVHERWPEEKRRRWLAAHERVGEKERRRELGTWMIRSTDGGLSWSTRYDCLVNSPHGPVQVSGGRLLYPGKDLWKTNQWNGVCESVDDGLTWRQLGQIPTRPGDDPAQYHELHGVEAANGHVIVQIRNENVQSRDQTLQSESKDGGKTWSVPHEIGVWGLPSHLLRLKDGRLLMTYGHRRPPFGNQARISEDHGRSWSDALVISGDGAGVDLGYPSTVELADASLVTVWYEVLAGNPNAVLRQAHWRLRGA